MLLQYITAIQMRSYLVLNQGHAEGFGKINSSELKEIRLPHT